MFRIKNPSVSWNADGVPSSAAFDDVYYNRKNGLAEATTVFLHGNNLPEAWQGQAQFTICETGFGSGLNFLATWAMFEETATPGQRLDFISVEQFPLHRDDLAKAVAPWRETLGDARIDRFLHVYPMRIPGFHRVWVTDRVTLTLIFDDALRGFGQLDCRIDAWYLDGFAPKKNPGMWQPELYRQMARLSHADTTLASFTAAGHVRRGLKEYGFSIKRVDGYGYKYHRITGAFPNGVPKQLAVAPKPVTIVGAGLAGAGVAHALQRRGIACTVVEKEHTLGAGASGNRVGLINPKIEAQDNPRNDAGLAAFSFATHVLRDLDEIDYSSTGSLHLATDAAKERRLRQFCADRDWLEPHMVWMNETPYGFPGVIYSDAASVNPTLLVERLLEKIPVTYATEMKETTGTTVLACGWGLSTLPALACLPLQPVRGQVTYGTIQGLSLDEPVMFGHYIAPLSNGTFCFGASFQQNDTDPRIRDSDNVGNAAAISKTLHITPEKITITGHWAQIRTASRDRFPIVGQLPDSPDIYISGALGSHGIQFGLLHGEIIACLLTGTPLPVGRDALNSLSIARFFKDKP